MLNPSTRNRGRIFIAGAPKRRLGRPRAVAAAKARVAYQARLLDSVQQALIATDTEGRIGYWNRFAEALYGWTAPEAAGRLLAELVPAVRADGAAMDARIRRGERWSGELDAVNRSGHVFPVAVTESPVFDAAGTFLGIIGVSSDISAAKNYETQLKDAQKIARLGSWEHEIATSRRLWSEELYRIHGLDPSLPADPDLLRARIHPDDLADFDAGTQRAMLGGPVEKDYRIVLPDGSIRFFHAGGRLHKDADGKLVKVTGIVQDVTERTLAQQELARTARQQAAIANLGRLALSRTPRDTFFQMAAALTREVLDADACDVLQRRDDALLAAGSSGWPESLGGLSGADAGYPLDDDEPLAIEDLRTDARVPGRQWLVARGVVSQLVATIGGATRWGAIAVHTKEPRTFSASDRMFLRAVATVLGQAMQWMTVHDELQLLAAQQTAAAELGRRAISAVGGELVPYACTMLQEALGVDYAVFLRFDPAASELRLTAGRCWREIREPLPATPRSQPGYTLVANEPIVVADYESESRFPVAELLGAATIRSGASVPVRGEQTTFGVLLVATKSARAFSDADVGFLQSVGNVVAEGLERDQAKRDLVESEGRYRSVIDGANEVIFTIAPSGTLMSLNPAFAVTTGWRCADWIGRPFIDLIAPRDRATMLARFSEVIAGPSQTLFEVAVIGREGHEILFETTAFPKRIGDRVVEIYCFSRDVTEKRHAENERKRAMNNLQLVLDSTADGIYAIDRDGICTMINHAAATMLGYQPQELIGHNLHTLVHARRASGEDYPLSECPFHKATGPVTGAVDEVFWRRDGTFFPVEWSASPILEKEAAKGAVVTFRDVTEKRALQSQVEQNRRVSSLGRLAATMAHEFNNVLMGIAPFVDLVKRDVQTLRVGMAVEQMSKSIRRGRAVTEEILRFSQAAQPVLGPLDTTHWLDAVVLEARSVVGPLVAIETSIDDDLPPLLGDSHQLHQGMMNLIINARDAMPTEGTITISARRHRNGTQFPFGAVEDCGNFVHVSVRDTGCGMTSEVLSQIFEPLFTTKRSGTGLGLPLTHQIITRHNGKLFVESTPGAGTAFHFFLPVSELAPEPAALSTAPLVKRHRKILLVEDDDMVSAGVAAILTAEGIDVGVVNRGNDVLPHIALNRPDAVVLDLGLPDVNGIDVYARLAAQYPTMPVLFSTGHGDRAKLRAVLEQPHVGFLQKPYDVATLLDALERLIA
jgi:PAS domain S-box-containing protein